MTAALPIIEDVPFSLSVPEALQKLAHLPGVMLFDSALNRGGLGRYSFLTADPFDCHILQTAEYGVDPFTKIRNDLNRFAVPSQAPLPPFTGGAAGLLSYELGRCFERIPEPIIDEFQFPAVAMGLYDWTLAWDHEQRRCWLISQGFPESSGHLRQMRARWRRDQILEILARPLPGIDPQKAQTQRLNPQTLTHSVSEFEGVMTNFSEAEYRRAVAQVREYILAGDIFQANLSQRMLAPATRPPIAQYLHLRECNPATFAAYFAMEDWAILSSSPERFLQVRGGTVSTRPIKGTRQRRPVPEADLLTRDELRQSDKDRSENVMIVDLLRNDLSRVCAPGSIRVPELCTVETYQTVTHLVSEVRGELRPDRDFWDLLRATFPGGSITGAPKIRAMEIITELEQVARGPYCGSLFYCGFDGTADSSILIRTLSQRGGWWQLQAGGGIVVQSDPKEEYLETLHKARGLFAAL